MNPLLVASLISFIAAVIWTLFIYRLDKFEKEPLKEIAKAFLGGIVFAFIALIINSFINKSLGNIASFAFVGFVEEGVKIAAVLLLVYKSKYFNEPMDGIFYASIAALGFGFVENIIYNYSFLTNEKFKDSTTTFLIFRGLVPFLHVILSGFWGYELGLLKKHTTKKYKVFIAYLSAAFLHSIYDLLLYFGYQIIGLLIIIISIFLFIFRVKHLNRISPFNNKFLIKCDKCKYLTPENSLFCQNCGKKIFLLNYRYDVFCKNCASKVSKKWKFCKNCGINLLK